MTDESETLELRILNFQEFAGMLDHQIYCVPSTYWKVWNDWDDYELDARFIEVDELRKAA